MAKSKKPQERDISTDRPFRKRPLREDITTDLPTEESSNSSPEITKSKKTISETLSQFGTIGGVIGIIVVIAQLIYFFKSLSDDQKIILETTKKIESESTENSKSLSKIKDKLKITP